MIKVISQIELERLKKDEHIKTVDLMDFFIEDLFEYRHPQFYKKPCEKELSLFKDEYLKNNKSIWIYYPWLKSSFKIPSEDDYHEVLTSRNKPYVSVEEQKEFYNLNIGIVGLSVGQSSAITTVRGGGGKNIKIADPDIISPSNLNRLHTGIASIGKNKTEEVEKELLEINPYLNIIRYNEGFTKDNSEDFFRKNFKLDVIVDACDNFIAKLEIRRLASKYKIPVIMATDLGDGSLIDIERYDRNDSVEPFGGRHKIVKEPDNFLKTAIAIISPENIPLSLQERFFQIGQTAPTHPQLANSVFFSGTLVSYLIRCLATGRDIVDERVLINYDELFDPKYKQKNFNKIKEEKLLTFKNLLGLE